MKKNQTKETIKQAIKDVVKELGLKKHPVIKFDFSEESSWVMMATGTIYAKGLFNKVITKTETDYVLHINKKACNNMMKGYTLSFGNKQVAYDCLYLLICHELRHMWQYQEQFTVGSTRNDFSGINELFYGHGSLDVEKDANDWMIKIAEKKGIKHLAVYMELEQRAGGTFNKYDSDFIKQAINSYRNTVKNYNKLFYYIHTIF